jgi:hypothetical protein
MRAYLSVTVEALVLSGTIVACGGEVNGVNAGGDGGGAHVTGESDADDAGNTGTAATQGDASPETDASDASSTGRACTLAGDGSAGATSMPLGSYVQCTGGASHLSTTAVLSAGGDATGSIALTESNGVLNVALGDGLFAIGTGTLALTPTSDSTAVVTAGQSIALHDVGCSTAATSAGVLAVDGNKLQLSIAGQGCGDPVSAFVECPLPASPSGALQGPGLCEDTDAGSVAFAAGTYAKCDTVLGGRGAVTVSQNDGVWTATLSGLDGFSTPGPGLTLAANNGSTALIASGQQVSVQEFGSGCSGPASNDARIVVDLPVPETHTLTTTNSWLVVDGATLYVFLGGTDECGSPVSQSFSCTAQ